MTKELEAFTNIKDEMLEWTEGYEEDLDIIEFALKEKAKLEKIVKILREDYYFNSVDEFIPKQLILTESKLKLLKRYFR